MLPILIQPNQVYKDMFVFVVGPTSYKNVQHIIFEQTRFSFSFVCGIELKAYRMVYIYIAARCIGVSGH